MLVPSSISHGFPGQTAQMEPLPLSSLIPPEEDLGRYYRYEGSLTTPDCYEGVIWTIFEKPIELSLSQVSRRGAVHIGLLIVILPLQLPAQSHNLKQFISCSTALFLSHTHLLGISLNIVPSASFLALLNCLSKNGRKGEGRGNDDVERKPKPLHR